MNLGMSPVYGNIKAVQEADAAWIIHFNGKKDSIEVNTNISDGKLRVIPLYFQQRISRYNRQLEICIFLKGGGVGSKNGWVGVISGNDHGDIITKEDSRTSIHYYNLEKRY